MVADYINLRSMPTDPANIMVINAQEQVLFRTETRYNETIVYRVRKVQKEKEKSRVEDELARIQRRPFHSDVLTWEDGRSVLLDEYLGMAMKSRDKTSLWQTFRASDGQQYRWRGAEMTPVSNKTRKGWKCVIYYPSNSSDVYKRGTLRIAEELIGILDEVIVTWVITAYELRESNLNSVW